MLPLCPEMTTLRWPILARRCPRDLAQDLRGNLPLMHCDQVRHHDRRPDAISRVVDRRRRCGARDDHELNRCRVASPRIVGGRGAYVKNPRRKAGHGVAGRNGPSGERRRAARAPASCPATVSLAPARSPRTSMTSTYSRRGAAASRSSCPATCRSSRTGSSADGSSSKATSRAIPGEAIAHGMAMRSRPRSRRPDRTVALAPPAVISCLPNCRANAVMPSSAWRPRCPPRPLDAACGCQRPCHAQAWPSAPWPVAPFGVPRVVVSRARCRSRRRDARRLLAPPSSDGRRNARDEELPVCFAPRPHVTLTVTVVGNFWVNSPHQMHGRSARPPRPLAQEASGQRS
jgi:hypothetical protein